MKPFFGIDRTDSYYNDEIDGLSFAVRHTSDARLAELSSKTEEYDKAKASSKLRDWLNTVKYYSFILAIAGIISIIDAIADKDTPFDVWGHGLVCTVIVVISLATFITLFAFEKKIKRRAYESGEIDKAEAALRAAENAAYDELGIPNTATTVDVLKFKYVRVNDNIAPKSLGSATVFENVKVKISLTDGILSIADTEHRYDIDAKELTDFSHYKKRIVLPRWNKATEFNSALYAEYQITKSGNLFGIRGYVTLDFKDGDETYSIYFPEYESKTISGLINIKKDASKVDL